MTKIASKSLATTACLVLLAFSAAACNDPPPPPPVKKAPEPVAPPKPAPPPKPNLAPPLSAAQKAALDAAFTTARGYAKQAAELKIQADAIERSKGRAEANDTLVRSKELYHKACEAVSDWVEGDLAGKISDAQVKDYLGDYVSEVGRWQKAMSDIGKVHKD